MTAGGSAAAPDHGFMEASTPKGSQYAFEHYLPTVSNLFRYDNNLSFRCNMHCTVAIISVFLQHTLFETGCVSHKSVVSIKGQFYSR